MHRKNILLTGGAGFIGANLVFHLLKEHGPINLYVLDKLTYAADLKNIEKALEQTNCTFLKGCIRDLDLLHDTFQKYQITDVIHLAAESHVDNSINSPDEFIQTNIVGTFTLLKTAYTNWMDAPFKVKKGFEESRFLHISTDEVYGSLGAEGLFTEQTPYAPNSPYSASKASSDMLVRSYHHTYGLNTVITNCSNNYGPFQHREKLIPTIIRCALQGKKIPIYGKGQNIRDWLYVEDHCEALALAFHKGKAGETYNVGGDSELTNIDLCHMILESLDELQPRATGQSYKELITYVTDRPGHDFRYAIDAQKIKKSLGWHPRTNLKSGLQKTIGYYLSKFSPIQKEATL